jgi:hypothetical protein
MSLLRVLLLELTEAERVAAPNAPAFFRAPTGNLDSILVG